MKPDQKLDAGSMNGSREQILFRKAERIRMALSPQAGGGAEALYSTLATGAADLAILAVWHQIDGKSLCFISVSKFKKSVQSNQR